MLHMHIVINVILTAHPSWAPSTLLDLWPLLLTICSDGCFRGLEESKGFTPKFTYLCGTEAGRVERGANDLKK